MRIGFVGLGTMGLPMASNLARVHSGVRVWNRTPGKDAPLRALGAEVAPSLDACFDASDLVFLMLRDAAAADAVLGIGTPAFARRVPARIVVQLGTTSAEHSLACALAIEAAGGRYVECPVSGSQTPAEQGRLLGMIAGHEADVAVVEPLLNALCANIYRCGLAPAAMRMKLAVNHYLIVLVTALAEASHAARLAGVDLGLMERILGDGPMASEVSRTKLAKLVRSEFAAQASVADVQLIAALCARQAAQSGAHAPLIDACRDLLHRAFVDGLGGLDMTGVVRVLENGPIARR